jgi:hypothetical protein
MDAKKFKFHTLKVFAENIAVLSQSPTEVAFDPY